MILSIGEILADVITSDGATREYLGGAPFNVAADVSVLGGTAGFIGRVGQDALGDFLYQQAQALQLAYLKLERDPMRRTTRAVVTLDKSGERDFRFDRDGAADYFIDTDAVDFNQFDNVSIVHLGTLMLSEPEGILRMEQLVKKAKAVGKIVSMDMNFRSDIYPSVDDAIAVSKRFLDQADIVKVSEDELLMLTGDGTPEGLKQLGNRLITAVTMGAKGSALLFNGTIITSPAEKVKTIDTTGAGDAFFAGLLMFIEQVGLKRLTTEKLKEGLIFANDAGMRATQQLGAILKK